MRQWTRSVRAQGKTIGLVPTTGYLHEGHLSLIQESKKHLELTVVSIYVNPGQFSPSEDLSTYPSNFLGDIQKLKNIPSGVDVVFHPQNLYDYGQSDGLEKRLCGKSRPVFFRGVATIVTKLFNIVEPDVAVFAEKGQAVCRELKDSVIRTILEAGGKVDYAEIVDQESLQALEKIKRPAVFCVAAWFGNIRLIDNMEIEVQWNGLNRYGNG